MWKRWHNNIWSVLMWAALLLPFLLLLADQPVGKVLHGQTGSRDIPANDRWSLQAWRNSSLQQDIEQAVDHRTGLRNLLVRTYNELDYRLFRKINAPRVIHDMENGFLELDYADEVTGLDYVGAGVIEVEVGRLGRLNNHFREMQGIQLLIVLPPSKARVKSDILPIPKGFYGRTNYDELTEQLRKHGLPFLDLNPVFSSWDDTVSFPLFPKYGGHWSEYGAILATDTILCWLAQQTGLGSPTTDVYGASFGPPSDVDYDLGTILNIHSKLRSPLMKYPWYDVEFPQGWNARDWLFVGDSHFEQLLFKGIFTKLPGGDPELWLYNKLLCVDKKYPGNVDDEYRLKKFHEIKYLVIFISERFYHTMFWGFGTNTSILLDLRPLPDIRERELLSVLDDAERFRRLRDQARREGRPFGMPE